MEDNKISQVADQPLVPVEQASFVSLAKEVKLLKHELKQEMRDQRSESRNVILAVVVAALLVFITVGVEMMIFHTR